MAHIDHGFLVICITIALMALLLLRALRIVPEGKRGIISAMGQPVTVVGPGMVIVLPFIQSMEIPDTSANDCHIETWSGTTGTVQFGAYSWPAIITDNHNFKPGDRARIATAHGKTLTITPHG